MSLVIEAVWDDPDMLEVRVAVSNGSFSGYTNVYVGLGDLVAAADHLSGFPTSPRDERRLFWVLTSLNQDWGGSNSSSAAERVRDIQSWQPR